MNKKGTPQYFEWLKKYRLTHPEAPDEIVNLQPAKKQDEEIKSFVKEKVEKTTLLPPNTKGTVHSKSQNKDLMVSIIRYRPDKEKYLVSREDGKFLYYSREQMDIDEDRIVKRVAIDVPKDSKAEKLESAVSAVTYVLIAAGIKVDKEKVKDLKGVYQKKEEELQKEIHDLAGRNFNINAPADTAKVLYDELKLPDNFMRATDAKTLANLERQGHKIAGLISEYRSTHRLNTAYLDKLDKGDVLSVDGRLRNYVSPEAVSGRFTSSGVVLLKEFDLPEDFVKEDKVYSAEELEKVLGHPPCS